MNQNKVAKSTYKAYFWLGAALLVLVFLNYFGIATSISIFLLVWAIAVHHGANGLSFRLKHMAPVLLYLLVLLSQIFSYDFTINWMITLSSYEFVFQLNQFMSQFGFLIRIILGVLFILAARQVKKAYPNLNVVPEKSPEEIALERAADNLDEADSNVILMDLEETDEDYDRQKELEDLYDKFFDCKTEFTEKIENEDADFGLYTRREWISHRGNILIREATEITQLYDAFALEKGHPRLSDLQDELDAERNSKLAELAERIKCLANKDKILPQVEEEVAVEKSQTLTDDFELSIESITDFPQKTTGASEILGNPGNQSQPNMPHHTEKRGPSKRAEL